MAISIPWSVQITGANAGINAFNWIAGKYMQELGYETEELSPGPFSIYKNKIYDYLNWF